MAKLIIELDDKELLQALVGASRGSAKEEPEDNNDVDYDDLRDELTELYAELKKETSANEAKEVLHEASGSKLVKSVKDNKLEDAVEAIKDALGGDKDTDSGDEVDVAEVVTAAKAFFTENGKDELNEILGDFEVDEVKTKTKIKADLFDDVEQDDLAELLIELTE